MKTPRRQLDEVALARLLRSQDGVVARQQVLDLGGEPADIRRKRRRREWAVVHDGVYVTHTGPITRKQRQWAAVLACAPAYLHRASALEAHGLTRDRAPKGEQEPIRVAIDAARRVRPPSGVLVERVRGLEAWTMSQRRPPRVTTEFATAKEAANRTETAAIALLADVCRQGLTTAERLQQTVTSLTRLPHRARLLEVLGDVASGTHSVLEQRYLAHVERAHGLPPGERQLRVASQDGNVVYRDVRYAEQRSLVELDGRFGHADSEDRWADLDRDLAAAVQDEITVRLGWGQVLEPCRVAVALDAILSARGWTGRAQPCGPSCTLADRGNAQPPDDPDTPRSISGRPSAS